MPRTLTNLLRGVSLLLAGTAYAEDAPAPEYLVDSVYDLAWVRDVALDGETGSVLVTMPDRVLRFETFPVKVTADVDVSIEGITSVITKQNTLVVMGDDSERGFSGGSILLYPEVGRSLDGPVTPLEFPLAITPFSQAVLTRDNQLFAVNPTWFSIVHASVDDMVNYLIDDTQENFYTNDLFLQCGTASKVSLFEHEERFYYVTSMTDAKLIEIGPVELNAQQLPGTECFKPEGSSLTKSLTRKQTAERAVLHALIENPFAQTDKSQVPKSLLTFDPDSVTLSMFPIREFRSKITVPRTERRQLDLTKEFANGGVPAGRFGLMDASEDGQVILVSYLGASTVHRVRQTYAGFEYLGRLDFKKPVKKVKISDDGSLAVFVIGDVRRDVQEELVLIKDPRAIPPFEPLTRERFSVSSVQELLNEKGFDLDADGIYGQMTQQAVQSYLQDAKAEWADEDDPDLGATRGTALGVISNNANAMQGMALDNTGTAVTPKLEPNAPINATLRGLFPLR